MKCSTIIDHQFENLVRHYLYDGTNSVSFHEWCCVFHILICRREQTPEMFHKITASHSMRSMEQSLVIS